MLDLSKVPVELKQGITELSNEFGYNFSNSIEVLAYAADALTVEKTQSLIKVGYSSKVEFFRGFHLAASAQKDFKTVQPRKIHNLGLMTDNSRNGVLNMQTAKRLLRILAALGYDYCELYTEDTYEVQGEPWFGYMRGRFTAAELKEINAYADMLGVELVPCIQTLAHLKAVARWPEYEPIIDAEDVLLVNDERTYTLIDNMFKTLSECFTSRKVNIGMDEAHFVGRGKYLDRFGHKKTYQIIMGHLKRVLEIASKYGFECAMWCDMFFKAAFNGKYSNDGQPMPEYMIKETPSEVKLIFWNYSTKSETFFDGMFSALKGFKNKICFAGGASKSNGVSPLNGLSLLAGKRALNSCIRNGIDDVLLTLWGDDGAECPLFAVLPVIAYYAERAYSQSGEDIDTALRSIAGSGKDDFLLLDRPSLFRDDWDCENPCNAGKVYLYNDYFLGVFDPAVKSEYASYYDKSLILLKAAIDRQTKFKYIFEHSYAFLNLVRAKFDIGKRLRSLYEKKDIDGLRKIAEEEMPEVLNRLEIFYKWARTQWETENKPHGFECQDRRLGGLMQRTKACMQILLEFCGGKRGSIPELEEKLLPVTETYKKDGEEFRYNLYAQNVTVNIV